MSTGVVDERDRTLFKPLLSRDICWKPHTCVQARAKGRCKLIVCRINRSLLLREKLTSTTEELALEFDRNSLHPGGF